MRGRQNGGAFSDAEGKRRQGRISFRIALFFGSTDSERLTRHHRRGLAEALENTRPRRPGVSDETVIDPVSKSLPSCDRVRVRLPEGERSKRSAPTPNIRFPSKAFPSGSIPDINRHGGQLGRRTIGDHNIRTQPAADPQNVEPGASDPALSNPCRRAWPAPGVPPLRDAGGTTLVQYHTSTVLRWGLCLTRKFGHPLSLAP